MFHPLIKVSMHTKFNKDVLSSMIFTISIRSRHKTENQQTNAGRADRTTEVLWLTLQNTLCCG